MDRRCRCRTPMPLYRSGRSHTKWRNSPAALVPVRSALAPVPASWAAAARERPRARRMPRCTLIATVPALRCAPRSGHLGDECAAMAYTCARSTRLEHVQALPRKAHAAILLPPGPGGRREYGGHTPSWQGRAVRGGSPRAGVSIGLRPLEPARAQGARYALGTRAGRRRPEGLGRPRSPRGQGRQNGWASRPPATRPEASRRTRDRTTRRMSDGAGSRLERPERPWAPRRRRWRGW